MLNLILAKITKANLKLRIQISLYYYSYSIMVFGTQYKTQIKPIYKTYDIQNYDIQIK